MSNTISTPDMFLKVTIGMVMDYIKLKSEINLIKLSKLLDGILKKVELRKILKLIKLGLDFSILLGLFLIPMELIKLLEVLSLLGLKELTNSSP
jgi:hypothetical protein